MSVDWGFASAAEVHVKEVREQRQNLMELPMKVR
jgi:hypothetical protein